MAIKIDERTATILREQAQMENDRAVWDSHWSEIAGRVMPHMDNFLSYNTPGAKRTERLYDATAALALTRFSAAMESMLTPRTQKWHKLTAPNHNAHPEAHKLWFDYATDRLFEFRRTPLANFSAQLNGVYSSLGAFGTSALLVEEVPGVGPRYKAIFLGEIYIMENQWGMIDKLHRKFMMTARQALEKFGDELPQKIKDAAEKNPSQTFEFIHCVKPNQELQAGRKDYKGMRFSSYYVSCEGKKLLSEGGYRRFPYMVPRYQVTPGEVYGRSPAMIVLPDINMVNAMSRTSIRAAHLEAEPPLLVHDDGVLINVKVKPNAINFGGVDENGRPKVIPLQSGRNVSLTLEMADQRRKTINDAFLITLFQILVEDAREMTATEVMERTREKAALLAPAMGQQQSELLGPMIERELDILLRNNLIAEPPPGLEEYEIQYDSPLSKVMKSEDTTGIYRWLEGIALIAQYNPDVVNIPNWEEIVRESAVGNGVPQRLINSSAIIAKKIAEQQQRAALEQGVKAAPAIAGAAKNLTQATQMATGVNTNANT